MPAFSRRERSLVAVGFRRLQICTIYKIVNSVNEKVYVGQTWNSLRARFRAHKTEAKTRTGSCLKLVNAICKHGFDVFSIEEIAKAETQEEADRLEREMIAHFNSIVDGYNIRDGGSHGRLSDETRAKMSASQKGKVITEETRRKISATLTGRKLGPRSAETKRKIREAHIGRVFSEEARARMSAAHRGVELSDAHRAAQSHARRAAWQELSEEKKKAQIKRLRDAKAKWDTRNL